MLQNETEFFKIGEGLTPAVFALDFGFKQLTHPGGEWDLLLEERRGARKKAKAGGGMGWAAGHGMAKGEEDMGAGELASLWLCCL